MITQKEINEAYTKSTEALMIRENMKGIGEDGIAQKFDREMRMFISLATIMESLKEISDRLDKIEKGIE